MLSQNTSKAHLTIIPPRVLDRLVPIPKRRLAPNKDVHDVSVRPASLQTSEHGGVSET